MAARSPTSAMPSSRTRTKGKWNLLKEHLDGVKVTDVDAKFLLALREKRSQKPTRTGAAVKPATLGRTSTSSGSCCATPTTLKSASTSCPIFRRFAARPGKSFRHRAHSSIMSNG